MKKVKLILTIVQAKELRHVAGNGYGDGDFYDGQGYGGKRDEKKYTIAIGKLEDAIEEAMGKEFTHRMGPRKS